MPAVEGAGFSPHLPRCTPSRHLLWPPCVEGVFVHGKRINRASARRRRPGCSEAESVGREPQRMVRRRSLCQKCRGWHRFSEGSCLPARSDSSNVQKSGRKLLFGQKNRPACKKQGKNCSPVRKVCPTVSKECQAARKECQAARNSALR